MNNKVTRQRQFPTKISTTAFVKLYTLHLIKDRPYYGNEIIDEISFRLKGRWEPSPGMLYPLLREMESHGYIEGKWDEPNKRSIRRYSVTNLGLDHYKILLRQNKPAFEDSMIIINSILEDIYKE